MNKLAKRAEERALEFYPVPEESILANSVVIGKRQAYEKGYLFGETELLERAVKWMKLHTYTFENMEEVDLYIDLFSKAMK